MKLEELTLGLVTQAVDAYLELAYGGSATSRARPDRELSADAPIGDILALFQEQIEKSDGQALHRYTMRLGNRNYPFMKLQLQEHIVPGEFYFSVDTHDAMEIDPSFPDYEAWRQLQVFNVELKRQIEERFRALELPTSTTIRDLCSARERAAGPRRIEGAATILVVDDEDDLAAAVQALLRSWGHLTRRAADGPSGLAMAIEAPPQLVLLDYELPEMDGLAVLAALRKDPATAEVPVLLCTASRISVRDIGRADGFLAKPFADHLLEEMVRRLLAVDSGGAEQNGSPNSGAPKNGLPQNGADRGEASGSEPGA